VAIPTPDAALAVGLGGRAAGGLHLNPPLAVGVVEKFSNFLMLFPRFHHYYLYENC